MLFHDEPLSLQVLDRLKAGEQALAPAFWPLEVLNSLLIGEKKGRISREQTDAFLRDLRALRPTLDYASLEAGMRASPNNLPRSWSDAL